MSFLNEEIYKKYVNTSIEVFDTKKFAQVSGSNKYKMDTITRTFEGHAFRVLIDMERMYAKGEYSEILGKCNELIQVVTEVGGIRLNTVLHNMIKAIRNADYDRIPTCFIIMQAEIEKLVNEMKNFVDETG